MAINFPNTLLCGPPTRTNTISKNIVDIVVRYDYIYGSWPASTRILEENHHSGIARSMGPMAGECSGAPRPPIERRH
jgi:hypothetical protein